MSVVFDGQKSFDGGMNSRLEPFRLPENAYVSAKNMEFRGKARTRRGSVRLLYDTNSDPFGYREQVETKGAFMHRNPASGITTLVTVQGDYIFIIDPLTWQRDELDTPSATIPGDDVVIVQGYEKLYFFFGEGNDVWEWSGDRTAAVTVSAVIPGNYAWFAYNRLWVVTGNDTVNASDLLSETFTTYENSFKVDFGDGSKIVAAVKFLEGYLLIFKEEGVAVISRANNFSTADDLSLEWIDTANGLAARGAVTVIGKDVAYLSNGEVRSIRQTELGATQSVDITLSSDIPELMKQINWSSVDTSHSEVFDNYLLMAVPFNGAKFPNTILAFDLLLKKWVSYWQFTDSNSDEDDGLWRHHSLIIDRSADKDELISVNHWGGCSLLMAGEYEDFVDGTDFGAFLSGGAPSSIPFAITDVTASNLIKASTKGKIEIQFAQRSLLSGYLLIIEDPGSGDRLDVLSGINIFNSTLQITVAFKHTGGAVVWSQQLETPIADYDFTDRIFRLSIVQDGSTTSEKIFLEGLRSQTTVWTNQSNSDQWFDDMSWSAVVQGSLLYNATDSLVIYGLSIWGEDMTDDMFAHIPCNEGSGLTLNIFDKDGNKIGEGSGNITWSERHIDASPIDCTLVTRGYPFGSEHEMKKMIRGDITYGHRQAKVSATLNTNIPFEEFTLLDEKQFSLVGYDIHGVDDWEPDNSNDDFDAPFRQDYAPVAVESPGYLDISTDGVTLEREAEHSVMFAPVASASWFQIEVSSAEGYMNIKSIALEGRVGRPFADARSIGNG